MSDDRLPKQLLLLESCKGHGLFMGPKNVGMMGCCLTSRSFVLTIVDILTAKIGFVKETM